MSGTVYLNDLIAQRVQKNLISPKVIPKVSAEVKVDNKDSDFYTIVELIGEDRLSILYEITQASTDHGWDISFPRISILGNRILNVFYVQNEWGEKIEEKQKMDRPKQVLLNRITQQSTTPLPG